jgi:hypothetical protein
MYNRIITCQIKVQSQRRGNYSAIICESVFVLSFLRLNVDNIRFQGEVCERGIIFTQLSVRLLKDTHE